jgi:DinB superfamily
VNPPTTGQQLLDLEKACVPLPLDAERWAEERQYLRADTGAALAAFRRRRAEVLALLGKLSAAQWNRGSIHPTHGRVTFTDWTAGIAAHDDNHLDQLRRALAGRA